MLSNLLMNRRLLFPSTTRLKYFPNGHNTCQLNHVFFARPRIERARVRGVWCDGGFRSFSVLHKHTHTRRLLFNIIYGNLFVNAIERKKDDTRTCTKEFTILVLLLLGFLNKIKTASDQYTMMTPPASPRSRQKSADYCEWYLCVWWQRCLRCQQNVTKKKKNRKILFKQSPSPW